MKATELARILNGLDRHFEIQELNHVTIDYMKKTVRLSSRSVVEDNLLQTPLNTWDEDTHFITCPIDHE